jgi:hypothetical protein
MKINGKEIPCADEILNIDVAKGLTGREREARLAAVDKVALDDSGVSAFEKGVKWAEEHPHWISVKDEKPPYNERVLLYGKDCTYATIGELCNEYGHDKYYDDEGSPWRYENITHWMPLPKAPKKGGSNGKL